MKSLLAEKMTAEEKTVLLHQLSQVRNAGSDLVNTVIAMNPSDDDGLLLILGALARNSKDDVQRSVVDELIKRLNTVQESDSNTEQVITLNYALGNTGSELARETILQSLTHDEIEVQVSAIRSLEAHVCQPETQQALINLLHVTTEDKVLEEVVSLLIEALENQACTTVGEELLDTTVETTQRLKNPRLYEYIINYLEQLGTSEADIHIATIKQQYNYGDSQHELVSDTSFSSRIKRGSDWDDQNSVYNVVADYSQRQQDVMTYPVHKAYIWGKNLGVSKLELKMGAGAFIGAGCSGSKIFARAAAKVKVWSKTFDVAELEYSDIYTENTAHHRVYVKLGSTTYKNVDTSANISACDKDIRYEVLWSTSRRRIFGFSFDIFIFVGTLGVSLSGTVRSNANASLCLCPQYLRACVDVMPSATLRVEGSGRASLLVSICIHLQNMHACSI